MIFPEEEEMTAVQEESKTLPIMLSAICGPSAIYSSSRAEKACSFQAGSTPSVQPAQYSIGRAEKASTLFHEMPEWFEDAPPARIYAPTQVMSSRLVEKQCSFYGKAPSKPVSVVTSGHVEKACSFQNTKP